MRQCLARKDIITFAFVTLFVLGQAGFAFSAELKNKNISVPNNPVVSEADLQKALTGVKGAIPNSVAGDANGQAATAPEQKVDQGDIGNPDSTLFKANALAKERKTNIILKKNAGVFAQEEVTGISAAPPRLEDLQNITDGFAKDALDSADGLSLIDGNVSTDMREEAMRNAALSYGARGGLAKRGFEIMEKMEDYSSVLDNVFDFKSLLIKAPSGLLIEPPIIKESLEAMVIRNGGAEAAVADTVLDINKNAKIVSAPRNWRQYLMQSWSANVAPPPRILWPQTDKEKANWKAWVSQGWEAGEKQAEQIFELNTNKLSADYKGMVRYRILLAQGMVSAPYTTHEERGVVGDGNQMRIGDRAVRITEPSRFLTGAEVWRPADR